MLLGVDVGTTCAKALIVDGELNPAGFGSREYEIRALPGSRYEQDAEAVFNAVKQAIRHAVSQAGRREIRALSVSVQGDAIIPVDSCFHALSPAHLGMDYRGQAEAKWLAGQFGDKTLFERTGMRPHPMNSLVKMLWMACNQPAIYENAWKLMTYSDYVLGMLGADDAVIDHTMASRTMAFDLHRHVWLKDVLSVAGLSPDKLSRPVPSGTVVGCLSQELADELGISPCVRLVAGGHDQVCAALGVGMARENLALDSHGTAEVLSTAFSAPRLGEEMFNGYYPCYLHTAPGMYFTFSLNHTAGILLKWLAENFCQEDIALSKREGRSIYDILLQSDGNGPSSITLLPYFNGSGTPGCDPKLRGMLLGLTLSTTRFDIANAVTDALGFELKTNLAYMRKAGIHVDTFRSVGGGAKNPAGLQKKADITGLPVQSMHIPEAACLGAAVLAGIGAGVFRNAQEAAQRIKIKQAYEPRPPYVARYKERYEFYQAVAEQNAGLLHKAAGFEKGEQG